MGRVVVDQPGVFVDVVAMGPRRVTNKQVVAQNKQASAPQGKRLGPVRPYALSAKWPNLRYPSGGVATRPPWPTSAPWALEHHPPFGQTTAPI